MELTDEALLESFRKTGDSDSFSTLVRRYQDRLYNLAYRVLANQEEAEEVVQDTFLRIHEGESNFRASNVFAGWLFRIAQNACLDILRVRQKEVANLSFDQTAIATGEEETRQAVVGQIADSKAGPEELLRQTEQARLIENSLNMLPEEQRIVVVLRDIEGFAYEDIAAIIGASSGTVRSRIHYGRLKLRELLRPYIVSPDSTPASR